jgi:subtilisin family serine protease
MLLACCWPVVAEGAAALAPTVVTLQIPVGTDLKTLKQIATVAEPTTVRATGDRTLREILRHRYGVFNSDIYALFKSFNAESRHAPEDRPVGSLVLPAGPRWGFSQAYPLAAGDDVATIARFKIGADGPRTMSAIAKANPKRGANLASVQPGTRIILPYTSDLVSFQLRAAHEPDVESISAALQRVATYVSVTKAMSLVPHLTSADLASLGPECDRKVEPGWHFKSLLKDVTLSKLPARTRALVATFDSGLVLGDPRFTDILWRNSSPGELGYNEDNFGIDTIGRGQPDDDLDIEELRNHGTHVAGLATARLLADGDRAEVQKRQRLMVVKVAGGDGRVDEAGIANGMVYAYRKVTNIVNLSFEGPQTSLLQQTLMSQYGSVLFVVAAGNAPPGEMGANLDTRGDAGFPARYAAQLPNVIGVAAHDERGHLACFSNYGGHIIDLAAPGIAIESTVRGGTASLNGTSQAAPLVSLAAALLASMDVREPHVIKRRLLASVDYVPALKGLVVSEGKLNIAKAVALTQDVVELRDGRLVFGTVVGLPQVVRQGPEPIAFRAVQKIIFGYPEPDNARDKVIFLKDGVRQERVVESAVEKLIVDVPGAGRQEFTRDQLRDLVPALFRED